MLQIALDPIKIAPACRTCHQKVNAQSFLCPGQGFRAFFGRGTVAMGSYYTYLAGRIAGEVAVFDSQGPGVVDRSAVLCK
jgi:hypothetical protein